MTDDELQRMLDHAVSFFLAAERCEPEVSFGNYGLHGLAAPPLVLYGFSVEIALKIISKIEGKSSRGHDLKQLYEAISENSRSKLTTLEEALSEADKINNIAKYFEDWRYAYEHEVLFGSTDIIRRCFIECHSNIRSLKPDLCSVFEEHWGKFEPEWIRTCPHPPIEVHNPYVR